VSVGSIRQATLNLLLNACAATASGGRIQFLAKIEGDAVIVEITDPGPGLPPAFADYLSGETDTGAFPANGLGLWIVRRLVSDEGGAITVASQASCGTTIRVVWPFRNDRVKADGDALATREEFAHAG